MSPGQRTHRRCSLRHGTTAPSVPCLRASGLLAAVPCNMVQPLLLYHVSGPADCRRRCCTVWLSARHRPTRLGGTKPSSWLLYSSSTPCNTVQPLLLSKNLFPEPVEGINYEKIRIEYEKKLVSKLCGVDYLDRDYCHGLHTTRGDFAMVSRNDGVTSARGGRV